MSKPSKPKYRTTNWSSYNESLRQRGALLLWIDKDMAWAGAPSESWLRSLGQFFLADKWTPAGRQGYRTRTAYQITDPHKKSFTFMSLHRHLWTSSKSRLLSSFGRDEYSGDESDGAPE